MALMRRRRKRKMRRRRRRRARVWGREESKQPGGEKRQWAHRGSNVQLGKLRPRVHVHVRVWVGVAMAVWL